MNDSATNTSTGVLDADALPPILRNALGTPALTGDEIQALLRKLHVSCAPIGAEALQRALVVDGHDPTSREFSQDLIARREE